MSVLAMNSASNDDESAWEFFRFLAQSRLLSVDKVDELRRNYLDDIPAARAMLVKDGLLTPYQMKRIAAGQTHALVLGQYQILDEIGRGGFGQVYKAIHAIMNRVVALKVIAPELIQDAEVRSLFLREVVGATRLIHPNIALAYDADEIDGTLFFAMEFVDGPTLEKFVEARGPLPIPLACAIILQAAEALSCAHEQGMVHRDVKPANLLLPSLGPTPGNPALPAASSQVLVKLVDFGLARLYPRDAPHSFTICRETALVGTPAFMSPEQARDFHDVDIRSDLYSLGCTFYFALTGLAPFDGPTTVDTIALHLQREPEPLQSLRPGVPASVAAIVSRLMAKDREHRYQTPAQLAEELRLGVALTLRKNTPPPSARLEALPLGALAQARKADEASTSLVQPARQVKQDEASAPPGEKITEKSVPSTMSPDRSVQSLWQEWCEVVESLIGSGRPPLDAPAYKALHRSLLEALRYRTGRSPGFDTDLFDRMLPLVEPWLELQALASLDHHTLLALWRDCRLLDEKLTPPRKNLLGVCLTCCLVTFLVAGLVIGSQFALGRAPGSVMYAIVREIQSHLLVAGVGISAAVLGVILVVARLT